MIKIVFLGTSCMVPTKERNHPTVYLNYEGTGILFDCGENTQRQIKIAGIRPTSIEKIFISHWHGDHVLGIAGLFYTLKASDYNKKLEIYGPAGIKKKIVDLLDTYDIADSLDYTIIEIKKGGVIYDKEFTVTAKKLRHTITSFGYSFNEKDKRKLEIKKMGKANIPQGPLWGRLQAGKKIRYDNKNYLPDDMTYIVPGKKITYITDTVFEKSCIDLAKDSDLLIIESTYEKKDREKAVKFSHMTSEEAAEIGKRSNSKRVILFHFSQRYKTVNNILKEAKSIFKNCTAAKDFLTIDL